MIFRTHGHPLKALLITTAIIKITLSQMLVQVNNFSCNVKKLSNILFYFQFPSFLRECHFQPEPGHWVKLFCNFD